MFLLTLVFILLTILFTQELQGVKTTLPYLLATSFYYLTTEPLFIEAFTKWSVLSKIDMFECREAIYGRLCLKVVASVLAFIIQIALLVSYTLPTAQILSGKNAREWVSMVFF